MTDADRIAEMLRKIDHLWVATEQGAQEGGALRIARHLLASGVYLRPIPMRDRREPPCTSCGRPERQHRRADHEFTKVAPE